MHREPPRPLQLDVPAEPGALAGMRARLRAWLDEAGVVGDENASIVLAVCEAAANSILHSGCAQTGSTIAVELAAGGPGCFDIAVRDAGRWKPRRHAGAPGGRGLLIMEAIMDAVRIERAPNETCVRMVKRLGPAETQAAGGENALPDSPKASVRA